MVMTDGEIVAEYRQAKSKLKQIGILADLNACPKQDIIDILTEAGEKLPGNVGSRKKKKPEEGNPQSAAPTAPFCEREPKEKATQPAEPGKDGEICFPEAVVLLVRSAALSLIGKLDEEKEDDDAGTFDFRGQVRGVLALVREVEERCDAAGRD